MIRYTYIRRILAGVFGFSLLLAVLSYSFFHGSKSEVDPLAKVSASIGFVSPNPQSSITQSQAPHNVTSQSHSPQVAVTAENKIANSKSDYEELPMVYPILSVFPDSVEQVIIVRSEKITDVNIVLEAYQKTDDKKWKLIKSTKGVVGKNGMSSDRREGDGTTPMGVFGFPFVFGSAENPGTLFEYKRTRPGDIWASNPYNDEEYNVWLRYDGNDTKARFIEYEDLFAISLYKYAAVLDYNYGNLKVQGRGSAIFLHIVPGNGSGTAGCIGIQEGELVELLRWMDPSKNSRIVIGTENFLANLEKPVMVKEKEGFVKFDELDKNILIEMRYATTNNFTGKVIYPNSIGILRKSTAIKLAKVNLELREKGLRIKVWDAYRPIYVQKLFWDIVKDARFVANPEVGPSKHNKGCAVDVTLVDKSGAELVMPSMFDEFNENAYRKNSNMSETARKNMDILTNAMVKYGFKTIENEWWHFDDSDSDKYQAVDIDPTSFK